MKEVEKAQAAQQAMLNRTIYVTALVAITLIVDGDMTDDEIFDLAGSTSHWEDWQFVGDRVIARAGDDGP